MTPKVPIGLWRDDKPEGEKSWHGLRQTSLHMAPFLEMVLPAFKWLTFGGFCLGLIESFLYGVYAGLVFVPIYNFLARRWGVPA
jgi:uncharacterized protein DUF5676